MNLLEKGAKYRELKKSYVIFLCTENPFDGTLHKYSFEHICNENHELKLGDDAARVFLTPAGTADDVSDDMKAFLSFMAGNAPSDELTEKLEHAVALARRHEEWRVEFMTLIMRDQEKIEEGRINSIAIFLSKPNGTEEGAKEMLDATDEEIAAAKERLLEMA